jgi:DNA-binding NarL/FixJ family response regulator
VGEDPKIWDLQVSLAMVRNPSSEQHAIRLTAVTAAETLKSTPGLAHHIGGKSLSVVTCQGLTQIVRTCRQQAPCVLVADISSLAKTDLAEFARAVDLDPSIKVLMVVDEDDPQSCQNFVKMGFAGVICRSAPAAVFLRALEAIAQGELWASRITIATIVRALLSDARPLGLTSREREILGLVAKGFKNQEIADTLFVSRETVRWHLRGIYSKLGVPDRKRAIEYALAKGMIVASKPNIGQGVRNAQRRAYS